MPEDICFRWHFPRGTLSRKMSGLELATICLPHMPYIVPLLAETPTVQRAFAVLLNRIAATPATVLDEIQTWFKAVWREEEDDIVEMNGVLPDIELSEMEKIIAAKPVYVCIGCGGTGKFSFSGRSEDAQKCQRCNGTGKLEQKAWAKVAS